MRRCGGSVHLDGIQTRYGQCLLLERNRASHDRTTVRNRYIPNALWPVSALWSGRGRVVTGCERVSEQMSNRTALHKISTIVAPPSSEQTVSVCCIRHPRSSTDPQNQKAVILLLKETGRTLLYPKYTLGARPAVEGSSDIFVVGRIARGARGNPPAVHGVPPPSCRVSTVHSLREKLC